MGSLASWGANTSLWNPDRVRTMNALVSSGVIPRRKRNASRHRFMLGLPNASRARSSSAEPGPTQGQSETSRTLGLVDPSANLDQGGSTSGHSLLQPIQVSCPAWRPSDPHRSAAQPDRMRNWAPSSSEAPMKKLATTSDGQWAPRATLLTATEVTARRR